MFRERVATPLSILDGWTTLVGYGDIFLFLGRVVIGHRFADDDDCQNGTPDKSCTEYNAEDCSNDTQCAADETHNQANNPADQSNNDSDHPDNQTDNQPDDAKEQTKDEVKDSSEDTTGCEYGEYDQPDE